MKSLFASGHIEAALTLGTAANEAWQFWKATPEGQAIHVAHAPVTHPTQPESSSKGDREKLAAATKKLLQNWNAALQTLSPAIAHPDMAGPLVPYMAGPLVPYGDSWADGDRPPVTERDYPAGLPIASGRGIACVLYEV